MQDWRRFDVWYSRAYLGDLLREDEGDFDALRAMIEELPEVRYKVAA